MLMRITGSALLLAGAATLWSCSGSALPSAPSLVTPQTARGAGGTRVGLLEEPVAPALPTDPAIPMPDPTAPPTPIAVIINIIGTFGFNAFDPNPIQAVLGDLIVWTNNDTRVHHIMLDDGTDVGEVAPGQSSAPMTLATPSATFHCTIHPSMIGTVGDLSLTPAPEPPVYFPPPPDDGYGYY
jgi:plastocyanin